MTIEKRFWDKVAKSAGDECWEWLAYKDRAGYGQFQAGRNKRAHRVAWELTNGPIPEGLCVLHHCDNPSCVNPAHLFLGTIADNNADAAAKGRSARGERSARSHLVESEVVEIIRLLDKGDLQQGIARRFGVSQAAISNINTGWHWGWLTGRP